MLVYVNIDVQAYLGRWLHDDGYIIMLDQVLYVPLCIPAAGCTPARPGAGKGKYFVT
jgi:hypothetical protein